MYILLYWYKKCYFTNASFKFSVFYVDKCGHIFWLSLFNTEQIIIITILLLIYHTYQNINVRATTRPVGVSTYEIYYNKIAATAI